MAVYINYLLQLKMGRSWNHHHPVPPRAGEGGQVILNVGFILQLVINVTASLSTRTILLIWLIQLQLTALGFPNFPIRTLNSKGHGFISLLTNGMG